MRNTILCILVLAAVLLACPAAAQLPSGKTVIIAPHTSALMQINPALCGRAGCEFPYQTGPHVTPICGHAGPVCDCFAQDGYDVSSWPVGPTPFFDLNGYPVGVCPILDGDGGTLWPTHGDVWVRAEFELCPGVTGMEIHVGVDNSIAVWLNGTRLSDPPNCMPSPHSPEGFCDSEGCAVEDRIIYEVDDSLLRFGPEKNVLALQSCDHGYVSFMNFTVLADVSGEVPCGTCDQVTVTPTELWPPNHKFREVAVLVGEGAAAVPAVITGVKQDEPVKSNNGDRCPDALIAEDGLSVNLRSERLGPPYSPGRIYHLDYEAEIEEVSCTGTVTVCVPHDQGAPENCLDSGSFFDSTVCPE